MTTNGVVVIEATGLVVLVMASTGIVVVVAAASGVIGLMTASINQISRLCLTFRSDRTFEWGRR